MGVVPALISAGANILGTILGNKSRERSEDKAHERNKQRIRYTVYDARKAGINPLTAIRGGAIMPASVPTTPDMTGFQFAAQYLGDAAEAWINKDKTESVEKYNAEIRKLELEQRQADLKISKAALGQMNAPKTSVQGPTEVPVRDLDGKQMVDDEGQPLFMHSMNQEVQPMYIMVRNNTTGEVFAYPNPELADMGPTELATFYGMTGALSKAQQYGVGAQYGGIGMPEMPRLNWGTTFKDNRVIGSLPR